MAPAEDPSGKAEAPSRLAVVLFNLGGPDSLDSVAPFLFNLFNDPAMIGLARPLRWLLARFISSRRAAHARAIYAQIGGKSPLLDMTRAQAVALENSLAAENKGAVRVFVAMRYWHPLTEETVRELRAFAPDEIVLLPLYPQFSATTTGSSRMAWQRATATLDVPTRLICCYPREAGFIAALADRVGDAIAAVPAAAGVPRILFSAHGLPKRNIERGDPYQWQVEETAAAVAARLELGNEDWSLCYQSRVGPLEWIGPATEDEIRRAGADGVPVVVVPIAFVSEHSETLVELDIGARRVAEEAGVPAFIRVPALAEDTGFIEALAGLVARSRKGGPRTTSRKGGPRGASRDAEVICGAAEGRICPAEFTQCLLSRRL